MASNFETALSFVLGSEGGKSNHPKDRGGKTNMGVTAGTLARARKAGIVAQADVYMLTRAEAAAIYKAFYWRPCRADDMPWPLCALHFDAAVNHGLGGAGKLLQRALNKYGKSGLAVDGSIGPATLSALRMLTDSGDSAWLPEFCSVYLDEREALFNRIVKNNPSQQAFLKGWMNRVAKNRRLAGAA